MSSTQMVCFKDICEVTSSKRIFYEEYVSIGIPFYRSKEIIELANNKTASTELFITEERFNEVALKFGYPQANDILLTSVGTLGQVYLVDGSHKFYFKDGNLTWFKNWKADVLPKYICHWLKSKIGQQALMDVSIGSTQPALTIAGLKSIEIPLPPLPEQQAIAEVLSSLDDKIDLLHRNNKTLEEIAETLFKESCKSSKAILLGDVIDIYDNKRIPLSSIQRAEKKSGELYPYYGAATIMDYVNEFIFDGDYLLLGEDGTVQTDDGYPVLQRLQGKAWVNNHAHVIKAKAPFNNDLLETILKKTSISHIVTGAVQPKINQASLKNLEIEVPLTGIDELGEHIQIILSKRQMNNAQIATLTRTRDSLLPKLMSGQVRVKKKLDS